jgi:uroporphyrinogen-III synthase
MHVLITRPEPDAGELKSELEALGHTVSVEPMLHIELLPIPGDAFAGAQAILATSRNAVRALAVSAALSPALELPIFTVGASTAELARASGFRHVIAGAGAARDLVALVEAEADRAKGPLVHVAGEHLAFDLAAAIAGRGYEVRNLTAYRAVAARAFTGQTAQRIASGGVDAVLLMSPRTAAIFAQLVEVAGVKEGASRLIYVCLSESVAEALGGLAPRRREIAAAPNLAAMLAAIARVATQSTGV